MSANPFKFDVPHLKELFGRAAAQFSSDGVPRLAAAFSFYALLSLAPLLVVAVAVAALRLGEESAVRQVTVYVRDTVGPQAADYVRDMIATARKGQTGIVATLISLGITFFTASNLFLQLTETIRWIWKVQSKESFFVSFLRTRLMAFAGVLVFGLVIIAWLLIDSSITWLSSYAEAPAVWQWVSFLVSVAFLWAVFTFAYRSIPKGRVHWSDAWFPALVVSIAFAIGKFLLGLYFARAGVGNAYGAAGALVAILLWIYYTAQLFFFGVELTYIYAHAWGSRAGIEEDGLQRS